MKSLMRFCLVGDLNNHANEEWWKWSNLSKKMMSQIKYNISKPTPSCQFFCEKEDRLVGEEIRGTDLMSHLKETLKHSSNAHKERWKPSRDHLPNETSTARNMMNNLELRILPSHKKKTSYFPLYWLVNRDPYNGLL